MKFEWLVASICGLLHDYPCGHELKSLFILGSYQSVTNHLKERLRACLSIEERQMERIKLTLLPNNLLELCSFCVVTVIATHIHNLPWFLFLDLSNNKAKQLILVLVIFTPSCICLYVLTATSHSKDNSLAIVFLCGQPQIWLGGLPRVWA